MWVRIIVTVTNLWKEPHFKCLSTTCTRLRSLGMLCRDLGYTGSRLSPVRYQSWFHWGLRPAGIWRCVTGYYLLFIYIYIYIYLFIHSFIHSFIYWQIWTAWLHGAKSSGVSDSWRNLLDGRNWCGCGFVREEFIASLFHSPIQYHCIVLYMLPLKYCIFQSMI